MFILLRVSELRADETLSLGVILARTSVTHIWAVSKNGEIVRVDNKREERCRSHPARVRTAQLTPH